ncbi:hypothetical protein RPIT_06075 [Tessaracoccus flavus]|uniref:Uncharacterized protein n=1 Tax=Tessaracoccus flavus TaxID=1610493 RepID=A0A1Q2CEA4_9ACTN|nr:hypothetical protein RPIT_06075 [Tessaracoccus flavus]
MSVKARGREIILALASISLGLLALALSTTFTCSEVSCGPTLDPFALFFAVVAFIVAGLLLFGRRRR